jgi:hypothetical protein
MRTGEAKKEIVMSSKTTRKKSTLQKRCYECPICEGGKMTGVELVQYLRWAQLVNATHDQVDKVSAAFAKLALSDEATPLLNKDDEEFLAGLNIKPPDDDDPDFLSGLNIASE